MTSATQTRRALLGAGMGAVAATVATAVGRPVGVRAEGQTVVVGGEYTDATSQTLIQNQTNTNSVIVAQAASGGTALVGIGGTTGVAGSGAGTGVYANSDFGIGVDANSDFGVALRVNSFNGFAIQALGMLKLETSGLATIPANRTSVTIQLNLNITTDSFLLLTPKANIGKRSLYFTTNPTANTFTIRISSARTTATGVSWLLLNLP